MRIVITTCPKYQFLLRSFIPRFVAYWGGEIHIDIATEGEPWSDQMLRICRAIPDEYFIRLCEDFYIQERVDLHRLKDWEMLAKEMGAMRASLQCVDDGYRECSEPVADFFKLKNDAQYLCSMEASIWKREFLLKHLEPGLHIWETETRMSDRARIDAPIVLIPEKPIVIYRDATRRGELRI